MRRTLGSILIDIILIIIIIVGLILCIRISKSKTESLDRTNPNKTDTVEKVEYVGNDDEEEKEEVEVEAEEKGNAPSTKREVVYKTVYVKEKTSSNKTTTKKNNTTTKTTTKTNTNTNTNTNNTKNNDSKVIVETKPTTETKPVVKPETKTPVATQESVEQFFNKLKNEVLTAENMEKARQLAKQTFIKITDFIFYGTEINGYTFNELTDSMKVKILNMAAQLDAQIEAKFPGYKDKIKSDYNNFVEKLSIKYKDLESKVCAKIGTDTCDNARYGIKLTADLIKTVTKNGIEALKTWYSKYRLTN